MHTQLCLLSQRGWRKAGEEEEALGCRLKVDCGWVSNLGQAGEKQKE